MSFDIGNIVGSVVKAVLPAVIDAEFPLAAMIPGLSNMIADAIGDQVAQVIDQGLQQSGTPGFQIKDIMDMLKKVLDGSRQPCDSAVQDHCQQKCGGPLQDLIDQLKDAFKDAFQQYKNENKDKCGNGKGGKGGAGGAGGAGGPIGFRELAKILGELEAKEASNVAKKANAAAAALDIAKETGDEKTGKLSKEQEQTNADIASKQFQAMEDSKAEAQIFQTLSSMISEVMKNFGGALQTAARG